MSALHAVAQEPEVDRVEVEADAPLGWVSNGLAAWEGYPVESEGSGKD
jgi:hypothetical protein